MMDGEYESSKRHAQQQSRRRPNVVANSSSSGSGSGMLLPRANSFSATINGTSTTSTTTTISSSTSTTLSSSLASISIPPITAAPRAVTSSLLKHDLCSNHCNHCNHHQHHSDHQFPFRTISNRHKIKPRRVHPLTSMAFVGCILTLLSLWFVFLGHVIEHRREYNVHFFHGLKWQSRRPKNQQQQQPPPIHNNINNNNPFCQFRKYPPHRYYQLTRPNDNSDEPQPAFLTTETEYIFGEWPVLLLQDGQHASPPTKLCVDQSEWLPDPVKKQQSFDAAAAVVWPFADGTNPSILTVHRLQEWAPTVARDIRQEFPTAHALVTLCLTNSQCTWRDTEEMRRSQYDLPNLEQKEPDTVRTILQILDEHYQVLTATTLVLQRDAAWGKQFPQPNGPQQGRQQQRPAVYHTPALDDARLFVHAQQIMISYREGPGFGYETQVLNPVHLKFFDSTAPTKIMTATLFASETMSVCCGRNMALMNVPPPVGGGGGVHDVSSPHHQLLALTWVDPVTVEQVDTTPLVQQQQQQPKQPKSRPNNHKNERRRLTESQNGEDEWDATAFLHRLLKEQPPPKTPVHKSHIHGTNAFMLPLPSGKVEYLGVAHFHRPNDRRPNPYARFGHHYTHAFYRVEREQQQPPQQAQAGTQWRLTGLSPEFVLPSAVSAQREDAEVIQFVSGLELLGDGTTIVLAYGINDCEAALTTLSLSQVLGMLREIKTGTQVVDYMQPLHHPPPSGISKVALA